MIVKQATLLLLATLLPASLPIPAEKHKEGKSKWGDEFCNTKFCAMMSTIQHGQCCDGYKQCCAYVELYKTADPFAYLDSHEVAEKPPQPPSPPPSPPPPPPTFSHKDIYVGPPKSMRLRDEGSPSRQPPSLSLTRHHHHHHHNKHDDHRPDKPRHHKDRRPSTPQPIPAIHLLDGGEDILKTSYNDKLVRDHKRICKHSYCSLLTTSQHKLCCNIYDTCCAYSNFHKTFELFHPDNGNRRR